MFKYLKLVLLPILGWTSLLFAVDTNAGDVISTTGPHPHPESKGTLTKVGPVRESLAYVLGCAGNIVERGAGGFRSLDTAAQFVDKALAQASRGDRSALSALSQACFEAARAPAVGMTWQEKATLATHLPTTYRPMARQLVQRFAVPIAHCHTRSARANVGIIVAVGGMVGWEHCWNSYGHRWIQSSVGAGPGLGIFGAATVHEGMRIYYQDHPNWHLSAAMQVNAGVILNVGFAGDDVSAYGNPAAQFNTAEVYGIKGPKSAGLSVGWGIGTPAVDETVLADLSFRVRRLSDNFDLILQSLDLPEVTKIQGDQQLFPPVAK